MLSKLQFLFFPQERNNQKAQTLHLPSLMFLVFLTVIFQTLLNFVSYIQPGVLGYASNISIEKLIQLTNEQRTQSGLGDLVLNEKLSQAALQKASAMFTFDCWSHNCNDQTPWYFFKQVDYKYTYAGENLARDFADSDAVVDAWMESPTHRDNVLNSKYEEIGFAVVDGLLNGQETTLVVQLFGTSESRSPAVASGQSQQAFQVEGASQQENQSIAAAGQHLEIILTEVHRPTRPLISKFMLTKTFGLILLSLLMVIFILDTVLIYHKRIVRVSGKSFIHLSFFIMILIAILLSNQGQIL